MNTKALYPALIGVVLIILVGYLYARHEIPRAQAPGAPSDVATTSSANTAPPSSPLSGLEPADPSIAAYTAAEVASNNSAASCWSIINGSVYDLTSWIGKHPGGDDAILRICGKDGSAAFDGKHGADPRANAALPNYRIGALQQ